MKVLVLELALHNHS
jgi:hypothetical protein